MLSIISVNFLHVHLYAFPFLAATMDRNYLSQLNNFYEEIAEQENALLIVQQRFLVPPTLPLYRLRPTLQLLQKMKKFIRLLIHVHKRDVHIHLRAYYRSRVPTLDVNRCCHCQATPCIYD